MVLVVATTRFRITTPRPLPSTQVPNDEPELTLEQIFAERMRALIAWNEALTDQNTNLKAENTEQQKMIGTLKARLLDAIELLNQAIKERGKL